jgi:DNA-binding FadR family transcriptional regulator
VLTEIREKTLGIPGRAAPVLSYHEAILTALESGDRTAARRSMRKHLEESARIWATIES